MIELDLNSSLGFLQAMWDVAVGVMGLDPEVFKTVVNTPGHCLCGRHLGYTGPERSAVCQPGYAPPVWGQRGCIRPGAYC